MREPVGFFSAVKETRTITITIHNNKEEVRVSLKRIVSVPLSKNYW